MKHISEHIENLDKHQRFELERLHDSNFDRVREAYCELAKTVVPSWVDRNPELTDQIAYYVIGSDKFNGDVNKGIIFMGATGTGKTVILKTLNLLFKYVHNRKMKIYTGREIERIYMIPKVEDRSKYLLEQAMNFKLFGIDDIGEEHASVKVYGTEINVGVEVLTHRHLEYVDKGHLTFITTNLNAEMFAKKYGARIESRIHEMANLVGVKGDDLRKQP